MKFIGYIYMFTNKINGKKYIGQTNDLRRRYYQHMSDATPGPYILRKAFAKYGKLNFKFEVLVTIRVNSDEDLRVILDSLERYYIRKYNTFGKDGYNATEGGQGKPGVHLSEETKKKIGLSHKGMTHSEETKRKISEAKSNISDETRLKMSKSQTGRKVSEETKLKMRLSHLGKKKPEGFGQKVSERMKGNTLRKGVTTSQETKEKQRIAALKRVEKQKLEKIYGIQQDTDTF